MTLSRPIALSASDRERVSEIDGLAAARNTLALLARLTDPSWAVRRAVVAALAALGDPAVGPMIHALETERTSEAKVAALVDALAASMGAPEAALEAFGRASPPPLLCDAAAILGRRRSAASVPTLTAWALHEDDNVAVAAMEALGRIGGSAGLDAIGTAARSGRFFRVFPAIDVLARSGDPRAVAPLTDLLADPVCALEAARALGRTGDLRAAAPLARLLVSANEQIVRVSALALAEIEDRQDADLGAKDTVLPALAAIADASAVAGRIERCLAGAEPPERVALCRVLGWLGADSAAASLVALLSAQDEIARDAAHALRRLGAIGQAQILQALRGGESARRMLLLPLVAMHFDATTHVVACLDDPDPRVRSAACDTLGRIGNVAAVPALFARLSDPDPGVAQRAIGALHGLGSEETERLSLVGAKSEDARIRRASIRMIGYFGWPRALDTLLTAVNDSDERVRDYAVQSLPFLDEARADEALFALARGESPKVRASAMRALGQRERSTSTVEALLSGLADADAWVRYYACQSIGRLAAKDTLDRVLPLLSDAAGQVRVAAIEALARFADDRATDALVEAAASSDPDARRAALIGLGLARSARGLPAISAAVGSGDVSTRLVALTAVASFTGPEAEALLARGLHDVDASVRATALGFLGARPGTGSSARLIALLDDDALREGAVEALTQHAPGRIPAILAALEEADSARARLLIAALSRMKRPDARAALAVALVMDRPEPRRAAAAALAAVESPGATVVLAQVAQSDPDAEVRRLATFALTRR